MTSGVLVGDYLWLPPRGGFWPSDSAGFVNVGLFLIASSGIIWASRLLRAERDRASAYFDVAGTIVVTISAKGPVRAINRSGLDLLGCEDEDAVIGHQWVDGFVPTVDREVFATALDQARRGDSGVQCEARIRRADMTERLIKWRLAMYRRVDRRALVVAVGEDVTEERKTASALGESEGRLRAVLRQVPGAVTILAAPHGTLIIRSDRTSEILGHASFGEAAPNLQQYGGEHADGRSYTSEEYPIVRALDGETIEAEPLLYRRPDGQVIWLEVYAAPIRDDDDRIIASIGMAFDVSARKKAEAALREALKARELLFREADHRIKNSLQMISTLLHLQQRSSSNPELIKALDDAIARVNSVAEVHSALQQSRDFRSVPFDAFLTGICDRLASLNAAVVLSCRCDGDMTTDAERAIPLGLISTEIMTNALRHAFSPGQSGSVCVAARVENSALIMTIKDDGRGMPQNAAHHGLGTTIIRAVAAQINADVTVVSHPGDGTEVRIRVANFSATPVPEPEY